MATIKVNKDDKWINILAGSSSYTKEEIDKALNNVNKTIVTNIENSKTEINNNINNLSTNIDTKIEDTKTSLTNEINNKANKVDVYYKNVLYTKAEVDDRIAKAKPNIDLTPYATKEELNRFKPDLSNYVTHSELSKYTVVERLGLKDVTYNYNLKTNDVSEYSKIKHRHMNWNIDFKDREDKYHHFQFNVTTGKDIVINVEGTQEQDIRYTFTDGSSFCIKLVFKLKKLIPVGKNVSILERETIRPEMFIANNNELPDTVKHTFLDNYNTDQVGTITVGIKTTYLDNTFDITYCRLTINSRNIELEDYSSITADGVYTLNIEKYYDTAPKLPNNDKARKLIIPGGMTNLKDADFTGWTNLEEIENNSSQLLNLSAIKDSKVKDVSNQKVNFDYNHDCEIKKHLVKIINSEDVYKEGKNNNRYIQRVKYYFEKNNIDTSNSIHFFGLNHFISYLNNLTIYNKQPLIINIATDKDNNYIDGTSLYINNILNNNLEHLIFFTSGFTFKIYNINSLRKLDIFSVRYGGRGLYISNLDNLEYLNIILIPQYTSSFEYNLFGYIDFNTLKNLKQINLIYSDTVYGNDYHEEGRIQYRPKMLENMLQLEHFLYINHCKFNMDVKSEIRNLYPDIPEIPFACFRGCVNLQEIIIMPSTKTIQTEAYTNCSSARYIHFIGTTPPTINGEPFKGVNCDMYVPDSAVNAYKTAYPQYASRIKPDSTLVLTDEEKLYN